jgi:hypothetical protein
MNLLVFAYLWSLGACLLQTTPAYDFFQVYSYFGNTPLQQNCNHDHDVNTLPSDLLTAFRMRYSRFELAIQDALLYPTNSTVLARLGDDLDEFATMVAEVSHQTIGKMLSFKLGGAFQEHPHF